MTEIVKGALGGAWALIVGWILPSALGLAAFGLLVLPSLKTVPPLGAVATASPADQALILLTLAVVVGMTLSVLATPLYRVLEGYTLWPKKSRARRIDFHRRRRRRLRGSVGAASSPAGNLSLEGSLLLEEFHRYPDAEEQVAPTLFGNAIRRFEYYASDRYMLDSQLLWSQLRGVAPEAVVKEVDNARAGVDFFVCLFYASVTVALTGLFGMFAPSPDPVALTIAIMLGGLAAVSSYGAAIKATDSWSSSVKAMVDLARVPLAAALGLRLPATLEEERAMWRRVGWMLGFAYDPDGKDSLDSYRTPDRDPESGDPDGD